MAVLKVACPKCGQKVSGDESFFGTTVDCPVCSSKIPFPEPPEEKLAEAPIENLQSRNDGGESEEAKAESPATPSQAPTKETSSIPLPSNQVAGSGTDGADVPSPVLGVISMVLGLVSVMLFCIPGILFGPAAIIFGHIARSRAKHSPVKPAPGSSAALTGLILGYLSLAGFILALVVLPGVIDTIRNSQAPE